MEDIKNVECESHPNKVAVRLCDGCGVPFCADCLRQKSSDFYCKYCRPELFKNSINVEYEIPFDERLLSLKKLKNIDIKYDIEHYQLWKKRKMSSPLNITIWGIFGIIFPLLIIVVYYKIGNGAKGGLIFVGVLLLTLLSIRFDILLEDIGFVINILSRCILIWAVFDARNIALKFQNIFKDEK